MKLIQVMGIIRLYTVYHKKIPLQYHIALCLAYPIAILSLILQNRYTLLKLSIEYKHVSSVVEECQDGETEDNINSGHLYVLSAASSLILILLPPPSLPSSPQ